MRVAQWLRRLPGVPLSVESQHEPHASAAVGAVASSWFSHAGQKRLQLLFRGRFLPSQLILFDVHLGSRHTESRAGGKLCTEGRMGSRGSCGWARQPPQHPKRTDAHSSWDLVGCFRMRVLEAIGLVCCFTATGSASALLCVADSLQIARSLCKWQVYVFILCGHRVNLIKSEGFQSAIKANL